MTFQNMKLCVVSLIIFMLESLRLENCCEFQANWN